MLKESKSVKTLEIQGARTYFVILFSGEMVNMINRCLFYVGCCKDSSTEEDIHVRAM